MGLTIAAGSLMALTLAKGLVACICGKGLVPGAVAAMKASSFLSFLELQLR
jgi:hypothetical protein